MSGYVRHQRERFAHSLFAGDKFCRGYAWDWLVAHAAFAPRKADIGGRIVTLKRGQLVTSVRYLATAWHWSKSAVGRFLTRLKTESMIGTDSGTGTLIITICNYDKYQARETTTGTVNGTPSGTAAGQQRDKDKEGKEREEERREDPPLGSPPTAEKPPTKARLPTDWALSDAGWAYARSKQIPDEDIRDEARGFHAYWSDRSDADARKSARGWEQCWEGWVRRIAGRYRSRLVAVPPGPGRNGHGGTIASIVARRRLAGEDAGPLPERPEWRTAAKL